MRRYAVGKRSRCRGFKTHRFAEGFIRALNGVGDRNGGGPVILAGFAIDICVMADAAIAGEFADCDMSLLTEL